jgi:putative GTP pyrophosphokinase
VTKIDKTHTGRDSRQVDAEYLSRVPLLKELARNLETETQAALAGLQRIDRISFRAKAPDSFSRKSLATQDGVLKYKIPLADIEDQVAGRILVFFRRDIDVVIERLLAAFSRVEQIRKAPADHRSFAYESDHLVLMIPPHVLPAGWHDLESRPTTFEMQVRTLFMHAWAEPEHDISYKAKVPLTDEEKRKIAWAAANAWGGDAIFEQVLDTLAARAPASGEPPP